MSYDSVCKCNNFSNNFNAPEEGEIVQNMLCNRCVK
jgi:hypothetical protein